MNLDEIIALITTRISTLNDRRSYATHTGDVAEVTRIDGEIEDANVILEKLKA